MVPPLTRRWCAALASMAAALAMRAAPAMEFSDLERIVQAQHPRSIEELLPMLPADLRSRYVLMFRSRSLHGSSFERPRAVLYSPDARFVLSFNGEPSQAGFLAIEAMQFDAAGGGFEFREIAFPEDPLSKSPPVISPPNPARCRACHGDPARPIWDTYPTWPGAYGENATTGLTPAERNGLAAFLRDQPNHPRYRYLLDVDRFADPRTFRPTARERYEGEDHLPPNGRFGAALGRLNFEAIVHQVESAPRYEAYRYALLAALTRDCGPLASFFPPRARRDIGPALARFEDEAALANAIQARMKRLRASEGDRQALAGPSVPAEAESLDRFRFIAEFGLGLPTAQWTTALEKGSYDFSWSPSALAEMSATLRARLARNDPDLATLADLRAYNERDGYCTHLRTESRLALEKSDAPAIAEAAPGQAPSGSGAAGRADPATLLSRCAACHANGVGPQLPFDRAPELARRLASGTFDHGTLLDEIRWRLSPQAGAGRMPLGINVDDADRRALLDYFETLAAQQPAR